MILSRRRGVTMMETMIVGGVAAAMLGLLLPALSSSIANSQGSICRNNLARLAQALNAYHDAKGKYPPSINVANLGPATANNGNVSPNWVINILPYMGEQALYNSVNWSTLLSSTQGSGLTAYANGQATFSFFTSTNIAGLLCPADTNTGVPYQINRNPNPFSPTGVWQYYARGTYAANACLMPPFNYFSTSNPHGLGFNDPCGGPTMEAWDPTVPTSWMTRGVMGLNASVSQAQITDGTSKTILLGETRAGVNAYDPRGIWADGRPAGSSVWFHIWGPDYCQDDIGGDVSALLASLGSNASQYLQQQCMGAYSSSSGRPMGTFRSQHGGGIFVAMADASVRFVSDSVERGQIVNIYGDFLTGDPTRMGTWERLNASGDGLVVDDTTDSNFDSTVVPYVLGDMNGDGVLDNFDMAAMELALADPAAYLAMYPNLTDYQQRGDINQDGSFNNMDIGDFEALLAGVL